MQSFHSPDEELGVLNSHHGLERYGCVWDQAWCWLVDGQVRTFSSYGNGSVEHQSPNVCDEMNGRYLYIRSSVGNIVIVTENQN